MYELFVFKHLKLAFLPRCGHIKEMSGRIIKMRAALKQKLDELGTPGNWDHITSQIGMFSYTGLNRKHHPSSCNSNILSSLIKIIRGI